MINNKLHRQKTLEKIDTKIKLLGSNCKYNAIYFLNIRLVLSLIIFVIVLIKFKIGYIISPVMTIVFYNLIEVFIFNIPIKKRKRILENDALIFFPFVNIALKSSNNLLEALTIATNNINSLLSLEFKKAIDAINIGKDMKEALKTIKNYIPSTDINNIILCLIDASNYGNNIEEEINRQLDFLQEKRFINKKIEINKIPIKIMLIYLLIYVPLIIFIIFSPKIINHLINM